MKDPKLKYLSHLFYIALIFIVSGCAATLDYSKYLDLPKDLYQSINEPKPSPKETGIINFDTYAIVRAKKGERVYNVADRINVSSKILATYNGLSENYQLGQGEVLAIPLSALPEKSDSSINIANVASTAINRVNTKQEDQVSKDASKAEQDKVSEEQTIKKPVNTVISQNENVEPFILPIEGEISSSFSYDSNGNRGINIAALEGEPIKATNAGIIVLVSKGANQPTVVLIRHSSEILSAYSNISEVNLLKGDKVLRGQIIGVVSTGADHLHFEIIKGTERIDPIKFLENN